MRAIHWIGQATFYEAVRSKVLWSAGFFALALVFGSSIFSRVAIGDPLLVIKDLGLAGISLTTVLYVAIGGSVLLSRELNRKTVFNLLSRPISRASFMIGKALGLAMTTWALIVVLGAALLSYVGFLQGSIDYNLVIGFFFLALEAMLLVSISLFFSSITVTPFLSGVFTFGCFIAGRSAEWITQWQSSAPYHLADLLLWILPRFDKLYVSNHVVFNDIPSIPNIVSSILYVVGYSGILLYVAAAIFKHRQFR